MRAGIVISLSALLFVAAVATQPDPPEHSPSDGKRDSPPGQHPPGLKPQNIDDPPGTFPPGQDNGNKGVPGQHPPKHQPMSNPDPPEHSPSDGKRDSPPGQHPPGLKPQSNPDPPEHSPSDGKRDSPPGQHPPGLKPQDVPPGHTGNPSQTNDGNGGNPNGNPGNSEDGHNNHPGQPLRRIKIQNIDDPPGTFPPGQDNGNKGVPGQHPPKHQPLSNPDPPEHSPSDGKRDSPPGQHPPGLKPQDIGNVGGKGTERSPPPNGQVGTVPPGQVPQKPLSRGRGGMRVQTNLDPPEHSPSDGKRDSPPGQHPPGLKPLDRLKRALGL